MATLGSWRTVADDRDAATSARARGGRYRVVVHEPERRSPGRDTAHLLRDHRLALPPDQELLDELATVRLRESAPGVLRLDHDAGRHDDRAVSLGLAALTLTEHSDTLSGGFSNPRALLVSRKLATDRRALGKCRPRDS
jgi:hypothetical protein